MELRILAEMPPKSPRFANCVYPSTHLICNYDRTRVTLVQHGDILCSTYAHATNISPRDHERAHGCRLHGAQA